MFLIQIKINTPSICYAACLWGAPPLANEKWNRGNEQFVILMLSCLCQHHVCTMYRQFIIRHISLWSLNIYTRKAK